MNSSADPVSGDAPFRHDYPACALFGRGPHCTCVCGEPHLVSVEGVGRMWRHWCKRARRLITLPLGQECERCHARPPAAAAPAGAPGSLVEAALELLDEAARLRDVGDIGARDLERRSRELLRASLDAPVPSGDCAEDQPCACAGDGSTCRGRCPLFDAGAPRSAARTDLLAVADYLEFDGSMAGTDALRRAALLRRIAGVQASEPTKQEKWERERNGCPTPGVEASEPCRWPDCGCYAMQGPGWCKRNAGVDASRGGEQ